MDGKGTGVKSGSGSGSSTLRVVAVEDVLRVVMADIAEVAGRGDRQMGAGHPSGSTSVLHHHHNVCLDKLDRKSSRQVYTPYQHT